MRQVISISLPSTDIKEAKKAAVKRGFSSLSAYLKHLCASDRDELISEKELLDTVRRSRKEYKAGQYIKANSLADLL